MFKRTLVVAGRRGISSRKHKKNVPTLCTLISILGLRILYHRYIHHTRKRDPGHFPVRQKGCVKDASGVKYFSMVARWRAGGDCVRRWIIVGISLTVFFVLDAVLGDVVLGMDEDALGGGWCVVRGYLDLPFSWDALEGGEVELLLRMGGRETFVPAWMWMSRNVVSLFDM
jgi:hypothetical protein